MAIESNIDLFVAAWKEFPEQMREKVLRPLAERVIPNEFVRISTQEYMRDAGAIFVDHSPALPPNTTDTLRQVKGRLSAAVAQNFRDNRGSGQPGSGGRSGIREGLHTFEFTEMGLNWKVTIWVPYARIHEKGGRIKITEDMRGFFWFMFYETDFPEAFRWKSLALATKNRTHFEIPARPYLLPAMQDAVPIIVEKGEELIDNFTLDLK